MNYNIIVATCEDNGIGKDNKLPWDKIPEDMRNFSKLTKGRGNNAIIMGKNTYESIGKPLPNRVNIILSKTLNLSHEENMRVFRTIDEIVNFCNNQNFDDVWVVGGESIYKQFLDLNYIQKIYITNINMEIECDTFFPAISNNFYIEETINLNPSACLSIWNRNKI